MDEENSLDFKALRAKFQEEEELLLKQPLKSKPVLPEKPKVVPPPQSPTNYMPAGARPSLLSTINRSLEGKSTVAPRVVFKDEKKESKKPLFPSNSKISKVKVSKDKGSKGGRERLYDEDVPPQKTKKEKKKEATAELVPATPPPKNTTLKKKGFFFKKSKRDSLEITGYPIMDSPSSEVVGPIPLIPVPEDITSSATEASTPKSLIPTSGPTAVTLPLSISTSSDLTPAPAFSTEALSLPFAPTLESETTAPIDTAHLAHPPNLNDLPAVLAPLLITPDPEVTVPTPTLSNPSPEPELSIEHLNALDIPSPSVDVDSISASPKLERPLSALSVLERAEEMNPGKRTPPGDSRIFNALEKARKMAHNHHKPASPLLMSPSAEDRPVLFDLPPIDYEGKMGQDLPPKPEMNGLDHRSSLVFKELTEDDFLDPSEVPPPPPRRPLSEFEIVAPPKPERPHSVDLSVFSPPPLEDSALAIPAPADFFSESDSGAQLEFGDVTPKVHSPELPVSDWGSGDNDGSGTIAKDGPYLPNGTIPTGEVQATTPELHDSPENSLILTPGSQGDDNPYEHADSAYDDVSTLSKKKGKGDVKKRKGQPKNPYAETQELKTEEKTKTGRFGKSDKKAAAEGPDEKELKKKEKQRMEKEKKEQKERQEREKKEQKEREKRENELKKKFKITGQEDAMYQAKVTVTTKGRKQDLPVKSGDTISIIRTTNCPKGKWLARDSSNNYGYVAVDHLDLDIKEMLELGKKAAVSRLNNTSVEPEVPSAGAPNHYPNESFTDDSEEWTCDDDEPLSPTDHIEAQLPVVHSRAHSLPVMGDTGSEVLSINHQHSHSDLSDGPNQQARHEALQKLATFFHPVKTTESPASPVEPASSPEVVMEEESVPESSPPQEQEFQIPIIPPPEQYADFQTE
ncbi:unnamed protein product [Knipowitschia caucasica]|uniref:Helically-extended SH3 domain-containing protein n=1 Tax=Knipowitschia caucasica TaxID=637954 RepID=A0AAV2KSC3_KNICA